MSEELEDVESIHTSVEQGVHGPLCVFAIPALYAAFLGDPHAGGPLWLPRWRNVGSSYQLQEGQLRPILEGNVPVPVRSLLYCVFGR